MQTFTRDGFADGSCWMLLLAESRASPCRQAREEYQTLFNGQWPLQKPIIWQSWDHLAMAQMLASRCRPNLVHIILSKQNNSWLWAHPWSLSSVIASLIFELSDTLHAADEKLASHLQLLRCCILNTAPITEDLMYMLQTFLATACHLANASVRCSGVYNEEYFKALDYILDEASKVGVRLILTMVDNWSAVDSKTQVTAFYSISRLCFCTLYVTTQYHSVNKLVIAGPNDSLQNASSGFQGSRPALRHCKRACLESSVRHL